MPNESKIQFREIERAAIAGDAAAQFQLAELYQTGQGCRRNVKAVYRWFLRAAEQEYAPAELELAFIYLIGIGVNRSTKEAAYYLHRAGKRGHPEAQFILGAMLAEGKVFKRNVMQARYWLEAAKKSGYEQAIIELNKLTAIFSNQDPKFESPRLKRISGSLDGVPSRLSEADGELAYERGVQTGHDCAAFGFARYRLMYGGRSRIPNEQHPLNFLAAVYELARDSASRRGYLDLESTDGYGGSNSSSAAYNAIFVEGVMAGLRADVYGDEETGVVS